MTNRDADYFIERFTLHYEEYDSLMAELLVAQSKEEWARILEISETLKQQQRAKRKVDLSHAAGVEVVWETKKK